jgi:hypothetical protein
VSADDDVVTVHVPVEIPVLTRGASRALLAILVEMTTVEVLDGPPEGECRYY